MQLPVALNVAIEELAAQIGHQQLIQATTALSENYRFRQIERQKLITTEAQRIAYLATRMPATFTAIVAVLGEVRRLMPELAVSSLLDLGAGPGTAAWAASQVFANLQKITLVERDRELAELGRSLARQASSEVIHTANWVNEDLASFNSFPPHDLVIASYALGELSTEQVNKLLPSMWGAAEKVLVIIEPGTMKGFDLLRHLRVDLLSWGGQIIAPCPHHNTCPLPEKDWCHFAARIERTALHRKLKAGSLGFEDEKYAYLAVARQTVKPVVSRILRRPEINEGFVKLKTCAAHGLEGLRVTRRDKEKYKRARKAVWGGGWE